jgi:hypothetical protein
MDRAAGHDQFDAIAKTLMGHLETFQASPGMSLAGVELT